MELLDRYLQAVKKHLPWKRQDDIIAELRANLESQLEERESELGRALSKQEMEDWLKGLGHPMLVAAKYGGGAVPDRGLNFSMYLYVMRLAMFWAAVVWGVVASLIIPLTTQHAPNVLQGILRMPSVLFSTAAWVTLVFAAMELITKQYPGTIPELDGAATDWKPSALPPHWRRPGLAILDGAIKAVAEVVFGFLFLSWLLLVPKFPVIMFGPGASIFLQTSPYTLPPVWWHFYWFALGANALQLTWRYVDLMRIVAAKERCGILPASFLDFSPLVYWLLHRAKSWCR